MTATQPSVHRAVVSRAAAARLVLGLVAVLVAGPVSAQKAQPVRDLARTPVQTAWPPPPDEARVHYVAVYAGSEDVGATRKSRTLSLKETLLGKDRVSPRQQNPNGFVK